MYGNNKSRTSSREIWSTFAGKPSRTAPSTKSLLDQHTSQKGGSQARLRIKGQFRAGKATNEDGNHNPHGRRKKSGRPAGRTKGGQDAPNLSVFSANLLLSAL
ncbi:hypothetical protein B0H14DRAFT_2601208 [Mycena olivaceomarginata]|nr:hypothetical protein B0H14DRAFT_2601208 [Mycena olivaceomarginata]